jgi:hypothetical protein
MVLGCNSASKPTCPVQFFLIILLWQTSRDWDLEDYALYAAYRTTLERASKRLLFLSCFYLCLIVYSTLKSLFLKGLSLYSKLYSGMCSFVFYSGMCFKKKCVLLFFYRTVTNVSADEESVIWKSRSCADNKAKADGWRVQVCLAWPWALIKLQVLCSSKYQVIMLLFHAELQVKIITHRMIYCTQNVASEASHAAS